MVKRNYSFEKRQKELSKKKKKEEKRQRKLLKKQTVPMNDGEFFPEDDAEDNETDSDDE